MTQPTNCVARRGLSLALLAFGVSSVVVKADAQDSATTRRTTLEPVVITVTRGLGGSTLDAPFAMTVLMPDSARPGQRHIALDESLSLVPGLVAVSRTNPSQDPRISIRGFGARSAFGVRGVRVLRDGMPLTLPDGQTPVDYLSLESVGRIEIVRGAAAALYGNASGGVIDLRTAAPPASKLAGDLRQWFGSDGFSRTTIAGGGVSGNAYYQADASSTRGDGFRAHSRERLTSAFARTGATLGGTDYSIEALGFDMPLAENPGALTLAQFRSNARLADVPSVNKQARKVVRQLQVGVAANRLGTNDEISASAFVGGRSLYNPQTFAVVDVGRRTYGASARVTHLWPDLASANRLTAGFDAQSQNDSRFNWVNCDDIPMPVTATASCPVIGAEKGITTLDQRELVSSAGAYVTDELRLTQSLRVSGGLRGDDVRFELRDRLIGPGNPDDSGRRTLRAATPYVGVVSKIGPDHSVYVNISSAFETPTTTELGNHPDGSAGINPDLQPQRSVTYETGFKGGVASPFGYDVAIFTTKVHDELVSYEIPGSGGRRYFRNAGRTNRRGAELGLRTNAGPLQLNAAYSYSDFRFVRYVTDSAVFDGKRIPGIPMHRGQSSVTWSHHTLFAVAEGEVASSSFVDDGNTGKAPGYEVMHLRAGSNGIPGAQNISIVGGVQNLFNRLYSPSVTVNAARGKFFEPAAGRTLYLGVTVAGGR